MNSIELQSKINEEYQKLCSIIGDAYFKINQYEKLIEDTKKQIEILNNSAGLLNSAEKKA